MKVFVIGSGGREHALVWSLARSPHVKQIYSATANAGILKQTTPANVSAGDVNSIAEFAALEKIDLVVVGPEQPLVNGMADALVERGVAFFGPSRAAARTADRQRGRRADAGGRARRRFPVPRSVVLRSNDHCRWPEGARIQRALRRP